MAANSNQFAAAGTRVRSAGTGRCQSSSVEAGRLGHRYAGEILSVAGEEDMTRRRLERTSGSLHGGLELVDSYGGWAWTKPLWT
jgi:hypothetical protein